MSWIFVPQLVLLVGLSGVLVYLLTCLVRSALRLDTLTPPSMPPSMLQPSPWPSSEQRARSYQHCTRANDGMWYDDADFSDGHGMGRLLPGAVPARRQDTPELRMKAAAMRGEAPPLEWPSCPMSMLGANMGTGDVVWKATEVSPGVCEWVEVTDYYAGCRKHSR